jgi:alkaline phosphatase
VSKKYKTSDSPGEPLFVSGIGQGAEQLRGFHDNTDIGKILATFLQED